jgi:Na+-transporting NADH:ubiquinone oxidoreductase subunit NqrC
LVVVVVVWLGIVEGTVVSCVVVVLSTRSEAQPVRKERTTRDKQEMIIFFIRR